MTPADALSHGEGNYPRAAMWRFSAVAYGDFLYISWPGRREGLRLNLATGEKVPLVIS
jgi:hypothetical protein